MCYSGANHYDSVYPRIYTEHSGIAQSIVYELLYSNVFMMANPLEKAREMMTSKPFKPRPDQAHSATSNPSSSHELFADGSDGQDGHEGSSGSPDSAKEKLSQERKTVPFPFKVAKALCPDIYRNTEYDSWIEGKKENRDYLLSEQYSPGDKCQLVYDELQPGRTFNAHIQEMSPDKGPVTVFIEELGEKHKVPFACLIPVPQPVFDTETQFSARRRKTRYRKDFQPVFFSSTCQRLSESNGCGGRSTGHRYQNTGGGGGAGAAAAVRTPPQFESVVAGTGHRSRWNSTEQRPPRFASDAGFGGGGGGQQCIVGDACGSADNTQCTAAAAGGSAGCNNGGGGVETDFVPVYHTWIEESNGEQPVLDPTSLRFFYNLGVEYCRQYAYMQQAGQPPAPAPAPPTSYAPTTFINSCSSATTIVYGHTPPGAGGAGGAGGGGSSNMVQLPPTPPLNDEEAAMASMAAAAAAAAASQQCCKHDSSPSSSHHLNTQTNTNPADSSSSSSSTVGKAMEHDHVDGDRSEEQDARRSGGEVVEVVSKVTLELCSVKLGNSRCDSSSSCSEHQDDSGCASVSSSVEDDPTSPQAPQATEQSEPQEGEEDEDDEGLPAELAPTPPLRAIPPRFRRMLVEEVLSNPARHPGHFTGQALLRCVPLGSKKRRQAINQMKAAMAAAAAAANAAPPPALLPPLQHMMQHPPPPLLPMMPPPPPPPPQVTALQPSVGRSDLNPDAQPYVPTSVTNRAQDFFAAPTTNMFVNSPSYTIHILSPPSQSMPPPPPPPLLPVTPTDMIVAAAAAASNTTLTSSSTSSTSSSSSLVSSYAVSLLNASNNSGSSGSSSSSNGSRSNISNVCTVASPCVPCSNFTYASSAYGVGYPPVMPQPMPPPMQQYQGAMYNPYMFLPPPPPPPMHPQSFPMQQQQQQQHQETTVYQLAPPQLIPMSNNNMLQQHPLQALPLPPPSQGTQAPPAPAAAPPAAQSAAVA